MPETLGSRFPFRCFPLFSFLGRAPMPSLLFEDDEEAPLPPENRSLIPFDGAAGSSSSSPLVPNNDATPPKLCCRVPLFAVFPVTFDPTDATSSVPNKPATPPKLACFPRFFWLGAAGPAPSSSSSPKRAATPPKEACLPAGFLG